MKAILLLLASCFISGCGQGKNPGKTLIEQISTPKEVSEAIYLLQDSGFVIYEYIPETDSTTMAECQYILLKKTKQSHIGVFYGLSDEFDESREGYLPGYFVSQMENLEITDDTIRFSISVTNERIFDKPVDLNYKTSDEAVEHGYHTWNQYMKSKTKAYVGTINAPSIIINSKVYMRRNVD